MVSDVPWAGSGYGRIIDNLIKHSKLDISVLGVQHIGNPIQYHGSTVYAGKRDRYGRDALEKVMMLDKPKVVVSMCDIGHQMGFSKIMNNHINVKWMPYVPVDFLNPVPWIKAPLKGASKVLVMSEHGSRILEESGIESTPIHLGVDTSKYSPQSSIKIRKAMASEDKFTVLTVGRNQRRKMLDKIVEGFAIFSERKDDALLLLHSGVKPEDETGYDLMKLIQKYGLQNKYGFSDPQETAEWRYDFTEDMMVDLYNASDVGVYGGAEGFGIPPIESQACTKPIIVGDQCNMREITTDKCSYRAKIAHVYGGRTGIEWGVPSAESIAKGLEFYYKNKRIRKEHGQRARKLMINKFDWKHIIKQWTAVLQ